MDLKICRVCLERRATASLFESVKGLQYCAKIMKCVAIVVVQGDGLPDGICLQCAADLEVSYWFMERCMASERALRSVHATEPAAHYKHDVTQHLVKQEIKHENETPEDGNQFGPSLDLENDINYHIQANSDIKAKIKKPKTHKKGICKYKYNKKMLPNHMRTRKVRLKTGPIQCLICDRTLSCHSAFESHMRSHTKEKPYSCDICKKTYSTKNILKRHVMAHYGIKEERRLKSSDKRSNRAKSGPLQCSICGRMMSTKGAMQSHMSTHSTEKAFSCDMCGAKYKQKGTLKRHMQCSHPELHPESTFICEHCGKTFHGRANIVTHLRVHTGDKPFKCPFCPATFAQSVSVIRHRRRHTGEKPYSCHLCGKSFLERGVLNKHMTVHSTQRNFNCHICSKSFKGRHNLHMHIKLHTNEKTWVCNVCGISVGLKGNLKIHMKRMHSEKSGICQVCDKHFSDVEAHMVAHTGEKPFKCKICNQNYATKRSLSHHMNFKHKNTGKFKCIVGECHKSFPTAPMLEFHVLKAHTQTTPYVCIHCARGFLRPSDLSRHLKLNHNDTHTKVRARFILPGNNEPADIL